MRPPPSQPLVNSEVTCLCQRGSCRLDSCEDNVKNNRGFSLLELLIVVAIILIIATIAIPSFLRSRQLANETSAVSNIRTLNTAQVSYSSSRGPTYGLLTDLANTGLSDTRFMGGPVSGYQYSMALSGNGLDYTMYATATTANTGRYDFYTTPDFLIRYSTATSRAPSGLAGEPVR